MPGAWQSKSTLIAINFPRGEHPGSVAGRVFFHHISSYAQCIYLFQNIFMYRLYFSLQLFIPSSPFSRPSPQQVARNQAILREIGKRSRDDFPQDVNPLHFGAPDRFYYEKLPFLRRYGSSHPPRPMMVEYDVGPAEGRKSAGTSSNSRSSSRDSNDIPASTTISEAGKQINDRKEISSNGGSGSSSSGQSGGGGLTLAAEQRQLEREQQREAQQEANKMLHSAVAIVGPQEMRFSNERVMLPNGMVGGNPRDSRDDDGGNDEDDDADAESVGDEDEYFQGSNFPSGRREQKLPKDDERLNSDDYRLRYLYRIQGKYFG